MSFNQDRYNALTSQDIDSNDLDYHYQMTVLEQPIAMANEHQRVRGWQEYASCECHP
jgi:hypothetical protein